MKFGLTSVILGSSPCLKKVTARNYYEAVSFIEIYSKVFKILANYINGKIVFWIKPRTTLSHRVVVWSIAQLCPVLCDPMDCSPQGSSVHGILQARILEWVAISSSRGSPWFRGWTHVSCVSCIGRWILYHCTTWEAQSKHTICYMEPERVCGTIPSGNA